MSELRRVTQDPLTRMVERLRSLQAEEARTTDLDDRIGLRYRRDSVATSIGYFIAKNFERALPIAIGRSAATYRTATEAELGDDSDWLGDE